MWIDGCKSAQYQMGVEYCVDLIGEHTYLSKSSGLMIAAAAAKCP